MSEEDMGALADALAASLEKALPAIAGEMLAASPEDVERTRAQAPPLVRWIEAALRDERVAVLAAAPDGVPPPVAWAVLCDLLLEGPVPDEAKSAMLWAAVQTARRLGSLPGALITAQQKRALDRARGDTAGLVNAAEVAAAVLERQGDVELALSIRLEDVLPAAEELRDLRQQAHVLSWVGDQLQHRGKMDEALPLRHRELAIREELGEIMTRAVARTKIADALMASGDHGEALRLFRDALRVLETAENPTNQAITLGKIARLLSLSGRHDEALRVRREREIPIYERLGDDRARAQALSRVADILLAQGHAAEALRVRREEELPIHERLGDEQQQAVASGRIADALFVTWRFDEALAMYRKAGELFERRGDEAARLTVESRIADVLEQQGHLDEALKRRRVELTALERKGDERGRAITLAKIAQVLHRQGKGDEALEILRGDVLPLFERLDMTGERSHALDMIGDILLAGGKAAEALSFHREALALVQRTGDLRAEALVLCRMAAANHALRRSDEALRILTKEAVPLLRRTGNAREQVNAMRQAAMIHEARGQLDAAVRILKEDVVAALERLGDEKGLISERPRLALACLKRNAPGDRALASDLLRQARKAAEARQMPYAEEIRKMQRLFTLEPS